MRRVVEFCNWERGKWWLWIAKSPRTLRNVPDKLRVPGIYQVVVLR